MNIRYVNYNRKSTDSEDRQILSLAAQQESAQDIANRDGIIISKVITESKSAKKPDNRPEFSKMISEIKRGHYNAIICWKLDRLARNMEEGGKIIELIQQKKIIEIRTNSKTYTIKDNVIVLSVEFGSANQYSLELAENVRRGHRKKARLGFPPGNAPFGFQNVHDMRGYYWVADNQRLEIVRAIFHKVLERSLSPIEVYRWAIKIYHPTTPMRRRIGGKQLAVSYFYRLLRNPLYAGYFMLEGSEYELDQSLPRMVTRAQFNAVQKLLKGDRAPKNFRHSAIYSGLVTSPAKEFMGADFKYHLTCDCGHKFSYVHRTECPKCYVPIQKMKNPKYSRYTYYYNVPKKKRKEKVKMLSEKVIEDGLQEFFVDLNLSEGMKQWLIDNLPTDTESTIIKQHAERTVETLNKKRKALRDLLADGVITKDEFLSDIAEIDTKLEAMEIPSEEKDETFKLAIQDATNFYSTLSYDEPEAKKGALKRIGSNLVWDEKNLMFYWPKWLMTLRDRLKLIMAEFDGFEPENNVAKVEEVGTFDHAIPMLRSMLNQVRKDYEEILLDQKNTLPIMVIFTLIKIDLLINTSTLIIYLSKLYGNKY